MGHNRARFFPEDGTVFRIDHDQNFQQTTNIRYQWKKGPWGALTWRYDSGLVAGAVANLADALALTPAEQAAIGFFCGSQVATPNSEFSSCDTLRFAVSNLTNKVALYNFHSTFSGTHFVAPRTYTGAIGIVF
jgi:hypothetical protein